MTLFEKIIAREIPAYIIYEDEQSIAFLDISQNTPGHTLVVPKKLTESFLTADKETLTNLVVTAQKLAPVIMKRLGATGMNVLMNCGEIAGQTIMHYHIHLIPRYRHDELRFDFEKHAHVLEDVHQKLKDIEI